MPKVKKRKAPVTRTLVAGPTSSTSSSGRNVIRQFHVHLKRRTQLQHKPHQTPADVEELSKIDQRIQELGGLERYQQMSALGQSTERGGGSEKVFIKWLQELEPPENRIQKRRLLEVGALKPDNYQSCSSWIETTPIDLHSRHPSIAEQDFFLLDAAQHHEKWDLISLSLVLNFVPDPRDRGRMLKMAYDMLVVGGYLFLALPLPCVMNSRYVDFTFLVDLMLSLGYRQIKDKWKAGGKMAYWLFQKDASSRPSEAVERSRFTNKTVLRSGNRNNFSILLT